MKTQHTQTTPIVESENFIILDKYRKIEQAQMYQTEAELECELIQDLQRQGYEMVNFKGNNDLLVNIRTQLEKLNKTSFTDPEWQRFIDEYLDNPNESVVDRTRKVQENHVYDFVFDNGHIENIKLIDKKNLPSNCLQVMKQFEQTGVHSNRYDVTLLVNGLPLVQIELKKRGVAIREAFNQVHRYSKESFNSENSLFKYLQIFVISNGSETRYFANTTKRDKNNYDFTMNWATKNNDPIKDLKDFTATFLEKTTLLHVLIQYAVFDINDTLLIMRPYQIAATERILWKIKSSFNDKSWSKPEGGGYVWHTTGSGKTLTSFKAARLATELDFIDKVFFIVDRKDLDYQTMKEYQHFSPDSVNGSNNTEGLRRNIEKEDNKIIVTTIQKLNNYIKATPDAAIYQKQVVMIFDECHRSQFGEAQRNIKKRFKYCYQFGFTGTPIFEENAINKALTTAAVFGHELHSYVITDAIRDEKVLRFRVDWNSVDPQFKKDESEENEHKLTTKETKQALLHPERISKVSAYLLKHFKRKTKREYDSRKGFNAMFAVNSIDAAKLYYDEINAQQKEAKNPLKVATIFSYAPNEESDMIGEIGDESFETSAMDQTGKEFLTRAIKDYNQLFGSSFGLEPRNFQNYYRDLAKRMKNKEVDLLIVVGMFLTGFDAPTLNTLFVDKNLQYHGLIQAFSRTNRIYNDAKTFGNVVTFRNLEEQTKEAIKLFGKSRHQNDPESMLVTPILGKSYEEYLNGFTDELTKRVTRGYIEIVDEMHEKFSDITEISTEADKKVFVKVFGEYLKAENNLQNFDRFAARIEYETLDVTNEVEMTRFCETYDLDDAALEQLRKVPLLAPRQLQDYKSTYQDIRDWLRRQKENEESSVDWDEVVFEVELLKSDEIDLDYILELLFEKSRKTNDKEKLADEITHLIRSTVSERAKENLVLEFIKAHDFTAIPNKEILITRFYEWAKEQYSDAANKIIYGEGLDAKLADRYIEQSLKRGYVSEHGDELTRLLPKMSPLNPAYLTKKRSLFEKISGLVEQFKGIIK